MDLLLLGIGLVLTVGTGFFVASEFALVNLDRAELEARQGRGEEGLEKTISALKITSTHLSSAQLGITLTTLLTGYTMEPAISRLLAQPLTTLGLPEAFLRPVSATVGILFATLLSMIVGELIPKNFALARPLSAAKKVVSFQIAFTVVFKPVIMLLNNSANVVLRMLGIEPKEELSAARSAEELSSLVRRSAMAGLLEDDTATLLSRTLRFSEHTAADVMTPRPRLIVVRRDDPAESVLQAARKTGFSRFPVIDADYDDVVGIVHVKQVIALPREKRSEVPTGALQGSVLRVPETMKLDVLLEELRGRGYQMAVVVDEYGGTAGVATLEDLVEELIGEVDDEHDRARASIVQNGSYLTFPASLRPDELFDQTGVRVPDEGPFETVAGFVVSELGRIPAVGDTVVLPEGVLRVERMDGRRIDRLKFTPDSGKEVSDHE
ncbi:hemolysin family protein [Lysinibacter sp. HNR]|uniref:hemolysin family protein n=1 Tax=Lysinibacter sp. HNR TaxID=3031408 RepID=UPI002434DF4B|nr:hemolysin family protein [Lysinibacter sp. HNR]WGD38668.1 hemolysin family protein [Lysinibacter sp. HNR]